MSFLPKLKIEVAVPTDQVAKVVEAISGAAKTGQIGDGKIFVFQIDHAVRIRTGETDADALLRFPLSTELSSMTFKTWSRVGLPTLLAASALALPVLAQTGAPAADAVPAAPSSTRVTPPGCWYRRPWC